MHTNKITKYMNINEKLFQTAPQPKLIYYMYFLFGNKLVCMAVFQLVKAPKMDYQLLGVATNGLLLLNYATQIAHWLKEILNLLILIKVLLLQKYVI